MRCLFILTCIVIFSTFEAHGQNFHLIDSLQHDFNVRQKAKKNKKQDSLDVNLQMWISQEYWGYPNRPEGMAHADTALNIARKINYTEGIYNSLASKANIYTDQENYTEAIRIFEKILQQRKKLGVPVQIYKSYYELGRTYTLMEKYGPALLYFDSGALYLVPGKNTNELGTYYDIVSVIFNSIGIYDSALVYSLFALKQRELFGNREYISISYVNIGGLYQKQADLTGLAALTDSAIRYYIKAIDVNIGVNNLETLSIIYQNIADIYKSSGDRVNFRKYYSLSEKLSKENGYTFRNIDLKNILGTYFSDHELFDSAIVAYNEALSLSTNLSEQYISGMLGARIGLSNVYLKQKVYPKAIELANASLPIAKQYSMKDRIRMCYLILSSSYAASKEYKKAYEYSSLFKQISDSISIFEAARVEKMTHAKDVYLSWKEQRQQEELAKLERERNARRKDLRTIAEFAGVASLISTASVYFLRQRKKKNISERRKKWVIWLGIASLLFLFEGLYSCAHILLERNHIESVTITLSVMAGLAFILGPLHHKLEERVKDWPEASADVNSNEKPVPLPETIIEQPKQDNKALRSNTDNEPS